MALAKAHTCVFFRKCQSVQIWELNIENTWDMKVWEVMFMSLSAHVDSTCRVPWQRSWDKRFRYARIRFQRNVNHKTATCAPFHKDAMSYIKKIARSTLSARTASGRHLRSIHLKEFLVVLSSLLSAIVGRCGNPFLSNRGKNLQRISSVQWMQRFRKRMIWKCLQRLRWLQSIGACTGLELLATWEIPAAVQWIATVKTEANWLQRRMEHLHHCLKTEFLASKPG